MFFLIENYSVDINIYSLKKVEKMHLAKSTNLFSWSKKLVTDKIM